MAATKKASTAKKPAAAKQAAPEKTKTVKAKPAQAETVKTEAKAPVAKAAPAKSAKKAAPKKVAAKKAADSKAKPAKAKKAAPKARAAKAKTVAKPKSAVGHVATHSEEIHMPGAMGFFSTNDLNKEFETMTRESMQYVEDVTAQAQAGVDAVIASSTIFAKGFEELTRSMMSFTQTALEDQVKAGQTLMGAKTLREFTEVQTELTKDAMDRAVAEATRISELSLKTANDAAAPITEQVNASLKVFSAKAV